MEREFTNFDEKNNDILSDQEEFDEKLDYLDDLIKQLQKLIKHEIMKIQI